MTTTLSWWMIPFVVVAVFFLSAAYPDVQKKRRSSYYSFLGIYGFSKVVAMIKDNTGLNKVCNNMFVVYEVWFSRTRIALYQHEEDAQKLVDAQPVSTGAYIDKVQVFGRLP